MALFDNLPAFPQSQKLSPYMNPDGTPKSGGASGDWTSAALPAMNAQPQAQPAAPAVAAPVPLPKVGATAARPKLATAPAAPAGAVAAPTAQAAPVAPDTSLWDQVPGSPTDPNRHTSGNETITGNWVPSIEQRAGMMQAQQQYPNGFIPMTVESGDGAVDINRQQAVMQAERGAQVARNTAMGRMMGVDLPGLSDNAANTQTLLAMQGVREGELRKEGELGAAGINAGGMAHVATLQNTGRMEEEKYKILNTPVPTGAVANPANPFGPVLPSYSMPVGGTPLVPVGAEANRQQQADPMVQAKRIVAADPSKKEVVNQRLKAAGLQQIP